MSPSYRGKSDSYGSLKKQRQAESPPIQHTRSKNLLNTVTGQGNNKNDHLWLGVTDAELCHVRRREGLPGKHAAAPPAPPPGREAFSLVLILLGYLQTSLGGIYKAYPKSVSKGFVAQCQHNIKQGQNDKGREECNTHLPSPFGPHLYRLCFYSTMPF